MSVSACTKASKCILFGNKIKGLVYIGWSILKFELNSDKVRIIIFVNMLISQICLAQFILWPYLKAVQDSTSSLITILKT